MYILEIFYFCLMPTRLSKYIISFQTDIPWIKSMSTYNIFLHNYSSTSLNFDQDIGPMEIEKSYSTSDLSSSRLEGEAFKRPKKPKFNRYLCIS